MLYSAVSQSMNQRMVRACFDNEQVCIYPISITVACLLACCSMRVSVLISWDEGSMLYDDHEEEGEGREVVVERGI